MVKQLINVIIAGTVVVIMYNFLSHQDILIGDMLQKESIKGAYLTGAGFLDVNIKLWIYRIISIVIIIAVYNFIRGIKKEESKKILFSIVLPLSKPVLAVMLLYYGVGVWNGWFWASTILTDRAMYPLQVILREILLSNDTSIMTQGVSSGDLEAVGATIRYATVIVATLPILCAYPFLQKYFTKGIMIGAVKE